MSYIIETVVRSSNFNLRSLIGITFHKFTRGAVHNCQLLFGSHQLARGCDAACRLAHRPTPTPWRMA